jgi:hypothetical protein
VTYIGEAWSSARDIVHRLNDALSLDEGWKEELVNVVAGAIMNCEADDNEEDRALLAAMRAARTEAELLGVLTPEGYHPDHTPFSNLPDIEL